MLDYSQPLGICGDGKVRGSETCDDLNLYIGISKVYCLIYKEGGCYTNCKAKQYFECVLEPSVCYSKFNIINLSIY